MRRFLFPLCMFLLLAASLAAQTIQSSSVSTRLQDYRYILTESPDQRPPSSGWESVTEMPFIISSKESGGAKALWVSSQFNLSEGLKDRMWVINTGSGKNSMRVSLNGKVIYQNGQMNRGASFRRYYTNIIQLPADFLNWKGSNEIEVCYYSPQGDYAELRPFLLQDFNLIFKKDVLSNFLNGHMYLGFTFLSIFIALYFLLQYIYNRKNKPALWFALANLALAVYFGEMGIKVDLIDPGLMFIIAKVSLTLFFLFLTLFILEYFNIFNNKGVKIGLISSQSTVVLLFMILARNYSSTMNVFTISLIPAAVWLIIIAVIMVKAIGQKNKEAVIMGIGVTFGIIAAVYDFTFTFIGKEPFFWLQGPGIALFDISIFVTQALSAIKNHISLQQYTFEMEEKKESLTALISELSRSSGALSSISQKLDGNIQQAAGSMEKLSVTGARMSTSVEDQLSFTEKAGQKVEQLLGASTNVYQGLDRQSGEIQQTGSTLQQMLQQIDQITQGLQDITHSGTALESLALEGESAIKTSNQSMDEIKSVSSNVYQVVDAMNDLADRTNLLSMNASIEAAHAGNKGQGFAVVAQEIKKLAEASSLRAGEVMQEINLIGEKITQGVDINHRVNQAFRQITDKTRETINQINQIYSDMESQRKASQSIVESITTLTRESGLLHKQTDQQHQMSEDLDQELQSLIDSSKVMHQDVQHVLQEIQQVNQVSQEIYELSKEAKNEALSLESLID